MKSQVIILKPAELYLKSEPVRRSMMKTLTKNIKIALKNIPYKIEKERLRFTIHTSKPKQVVKAVKNVFGISTITEVIPSALDDLPKKALTLAKPNKSFAVRVNRADKTIKKSSKDLEIEIGKFIQDKTKAEVNLTKPDIQINIDIFKGMAYISLESIQGVGGLPEGVSSRVVSVITKKKDKLASWMMKRRGCEIIPMNVKEINIKKIEKFVKDNKAKAIVLGNTEISTLTSEFPIFTPLVGLNTSKINRLEKVANF